MNNQADNRRNNTILSLIGLTALIIAIILTLLSMLYGNTTIVEGGDIKTTQSLTCESDQVVYPFFENDKANKRLLKISVIMHDDKVDTISLVYKLYYDDNRMIDGFTTSLHSAITESFGADGLEADALGATYSVLSDAAQMLLYAEARNINEVTNKYFLLENVKDVYEKDNVLKAYGAKGLKCVLNEQDNNNK